MNTSLPVVLCVDLGTSSMKVALVTVHGEVLDWEARAIETLLTADGGAEQVPDAWWQALVDASGSMFKRQLVARQRIVAVCCSTQGEGTIAVDNAGKVLSNALIWMDMRGAPPLRRQSRGLVNVAGVHPWKLARWLRLTGGMPSLSGKDPAAHMLFVRDTMPEVYARTHKFLNVLDYLNLRLTGRCVATFDSILTSWVTDNRDPDRVVYDASLLRACGVDESKFPALVHGTAVLGRLTREAARELGLSTTVQVVAGAIDNTAAAVGAGTVADYSVHLYVGTSSWLGAHVPFKKTDLATAIASVPCVVPGKYLLTALQATAGGNLSFMRDNLLFPADVLAVAGAAPLPSELDALAATAPAGSDGLLYTPWPWGERAPVEDQTLRAGLFNLSLRHTRAHLLRATLEGVAFNTRWLLEPVQRFLGRDVQRIRIVGGGASSALWCQIFADVLGTQVEQMAEPVQANARGAAFIAAAGLGYIAMPDADALVKVCHTFDPRPEHARLYGSQFAAFTHIYRQMKAVYRGLNARESGDASHQH